jgi:ATP-dependent Clp protease ATP-binding subunit ClpA
MKNLEVFKERFAETGWHIFEQAVRESRQAGTNCVSVDHILSALASDESSLFNVVMNRLGVDSNAVLTLIHGRKDQGLRHDGEGVRLSPDVSNLFRLALARCRARGRKQIEAEDIFTVLAQDSSSQLKQFLESLNVGQETLMAAVFECAQPTHCEAQQVVRIKSGPYASFTGKIEESSADQTTVKVTVTAFGRRVMLELDRGEVEEITFIKR